MIRKEVGDRTHDWGDTPLSLSTPLFQNKGFGSSIPKISQTETPNRVDPVLSKKSETIQPLVPRPCSVNGLRLRGCEGGIGVVMVVVPLFDVLISVGLSK